MYPTTGMPTSRAPSPFRAMPSRNKNPLRDWPHGVMGASLAPTAAARRASRQHLRPVAPSTARHHRRRANRHSKIRSACDDAGPQMLIAHEREIGRIGDTATSRAAASVVAVTARARPGKDATAAIRIAGLAARPSSVVGWNLVPREGDRSPPALLYSANENLNLLICERAARAERKRWLRRSRHADGDH